MAKEKTLSFRDVPRNVEDLKKLDITDEYTAASAVVFALAVYEEDPDECLAMLEYINGPQDTNVYDKNFLRNQFDQYPYVARSYFKGATVENGYKPEEPYTLTWKENPYSRQEPGYLKLWIHSAGADSDRPLTLRQKASTGEWFMFSDTYKGLLTGIRKPATEDEWA